MLSQLNVMIQRCRSAKVLKQSAIAEESEFNFGVACLILISVFTSQQLQSAEKSSNPDFEADFYLGSNSRKNSWFQTQNFKPKNGYFWFTLTCPLSFLDRTCPDVCTNPSQGICDTSTGICDCKPGFVGHNCAGNIKHSLHTCKKYLS